MRRLPLRGLEQRPLLGDPKEYVQNLIEHGFSVSTIGAMNGLGLAGYPTVFLPPVDGMDPDWIPGVIKEAHAHGIPVICWNVFNVQDVRNIGDFRMAHLYPDWKMEYIDEPGIEYGERIGMCVTSSPYLEQHAKVLREITALGVDAMWFDGFYLAGIPHPARPGCVCAHCAAAFREDTGLALPKTVDWSDLTFRKWVRWRNERLTAAARFITNEIHDVQPDIPVIFNYNQWPFSSKDWETGLPLWTTSDYGVSQHAYTSDDRFSWVMLGYKAQLSHDLNPEYSDIWRMGRPLFDIDAEPDAARIHELQIKMHLLASLTYGTIPWRSTHDYPEAQKRNNEALRVREDAFRTHSAATVGLLVSQDTHDFWGHRPGTENLIEYRDSILGTWLLLTEHHIGFDLVFDNQLESVPDRYQTLILAQTVCMSDRAAAGIERWVRAGGTLILTGDAGLSDEWGEPRTVPLFGTCATDPGEPDSGRVSGTSTEGASGSGDARRVSGTGTAGAHGSGDRETFGSGRVVRLESDPGTTYARTRDRQSARSLVRAIDPAALTFIVTGPPEVVVRLYHDPETSGFVLHVLNLSPYYRYENGCGFTGVRGTPAGPVPQFGSVTETASDASEGQSGPDQPPRESFAEREIAEIRVTIPRAVGWKARFTVRRDEITIGDDGTLVITNLMDHEAVTIAP